jgi:hypothetical protein
MKKVAFGAKPQGSGDRPSPDQWVAAGQASEPIKRLTIDIPLALHKRIKSQCAMRGENMADEIRKLLEKQFPEEYQQRGGSSEPSSN